MKFVLMLLASNMACAEDETLVQKEGWATYEAGLDRVLKKVNDTCGSRVDGSYDRSTYEAFDPMTDRTQSACEQATAALGALCITEPGKQSVQALRTVSCRLSHEGTKVKRDGSQIEVYVDPQKTSIVGAKPGSYNWASAIKEVL